MDGQLKIVDGPNKGQVIDFEDGQVLRIGRATTADAPINDPYVSRMHCQIEVKGGQLILSDLGSSRGTDVNGKAITGPQPIKPGDVITIGATRMVVEEQGSDAEKTIMPFAPTASSAMRATLETPLDAANLEGSKFAGYDIAKKLGSGTGGVVYQAAKKGEAPVALKVFHAEFSNDAETKQRFFRSARTMRDLRHPHLVSILDAGENTPFCWLAMELVEGETLSKIIQRIGIAGILDWRYSLRIAVHVARGLEFAQKNSIIHRNIKPPNILVRKSDNFAKLGDLMLAKALEGDRVEAVTTPGMTLGDIDYCSPERALCKDVDGRSDLFELGATIYALLTGHPPFRGKTYADRVRELQGSTPASPKKVQLSIPDEFNAVVMRLLANEPDQRFQTPTELLKALEEIARDEKVNA